MKAILLGLYVWNLQDACGTKFLDFMEDMMTGTMFMCGTPSMLMESSGTMMPGSA
jgi:hypothetical protein